MAHQFNRELITPSFSKCNRTPSSREDDAKMLASALASCKIKPTVVPGFTGVAPMPLRANRVDPETRLKRAVRKTSRRVAAELELYRKEHKEKIRERELLRGMVESLEVVE
ncbi:hypothetical protein [Pseudomonas sp.]|uniref:hypothetical protein n=1 Tax=Pseudomonas sp. TaxID=306 RepID=UPI002584AFE3|nr:hypothetical protein [Pseudomonas sp.]